MPLISDDRLKKADNLLLPGRHNVELPTRLGEAVVDMSAEVDEVLPKGVETCGRGSAEVADFAAELADVAVGGPGEHSSGGRVLFARLYSSR